MQDEAITKWQSHKHPESRDFMQVVKFMHISYPDGRNNLHWSLANCSANDHHLITNISLSDAQSLYCDAPSVELTEEDFREWLKNKH